MNQETYAHDKRGSLCLVMGKEPEIVMAYYKADNQRVAIWFAGDEEGKYINIF